MPADPIIAQIVFFLGAGSIDFPMLRASPVNAFTVDVEDYFQVTAFDKAVRRSDWDSLESRIAASTHKLLDLLAQYQVRGTFFVLGWVARKHPELVRQIQSAGHELASHSYWHKLIYSMTPDEFRQDLRDSKAAIEDASGAVVKLFRAPSFSITKQSLWALDILVEEGITVDSSIFPARHDRYGIPNARHDIHELQLSAGCLCEFPPTVARLFGVKLPAGGGGYFRLYPWRLTQYLLNQVNAQGRPFMFYVHPWELDPDQPRIPCRSAFGKFRHYNNLGRTESRLSRLLQNYRFSTVSDVVQHHLGKAVSTSKVVDPLECSAT